MIKTKMRDNPVITIHIAPGDKHELETKAKQLSMPLTIYCRMILLQSLNKDK